jgi:hypothetical protein
MTTKHRPRAAVDFSSALGAVATVILAVSAHATPAVEATQLDYVALDASVECNRILFQSSQHFKRTIFAMPRLVPGTGLEAGRVYEISPAERPGFYHLYLRFYFPANDEVIKGSAASSFKRDLQACNWDAVKHAINKSIPDSRDRIETVSRIPLTSLEVRIPGIRSVARIGRSQDEAVFVEKPTAKGPMNTKDTAKEGEANIIDYYGRSLTAHFLINEADRAFFERQIVSGSGMPVEIQLRFQARSRDGSVHARIDTQNLIANFEAQTSIQGLKFLTGAQVAVALRASLNEKSIQISTESGSSATIQNVADKIFDKVMNEISLSIPAKPEAKAADGKPPAGGAAEGKIALAAALDVLRTKVSSEISYNNFTGSEVATAQTELAFRVDRLNDPNVAEVELKAGYKDPSAGFTMNAGQSITINAAFWFIEKIKYPEVSVYLNLSDLKLLELGTVFPDILDHQMEINNIELNGILFAEGKWKALSLVPNFQRYRWRRVIRTADRVRTSSGVIEPTAEAMAELPVAISFSELGDRRFFKIKDLMASGATDTKSGAIVENPYVSTLFDRTTGRLVLTAKQNLGTIRFRDLMTDTASLKVEPKGVVLEEVVQETLNPWGKRSITQRHSLKSDADPIVLQKTLLLYVGRPRVLKASELSAIKSRAQTLTPTTRSPKLP